MSDSLRFFSFLCATTAISLSAQQAQPPQLTARELFYNSTNPPAAKAITKTPPKAVAKKKQAAPATQDASNTTPPSPSSPSNPPDPNTKIIAVADGSRATAPAPMTGTPLGLKYTLLKLTGDRMMPAAPSSVFHADDKIQFSVETNSPGYLYIVSQGSSGTWKPVFPAPEIEGGDNRVEPFHTYVLPAGYRYSFDHQPGDEKLFIIFSRDAKPDFEQLVYSLQGEKSKPASQPSTPAAPAASTHVLRASIDDSAIGQLHQTYARDLVIEKVGDDAKPAGSQDKAEEKAVYVVNATGRPDSALVADLNLVHK